MRRPLSLLAAAGLLLAGCSYDFQNPAEKLDSGEVTGRVVADQSGNGQLTGISGVSVELRNSYSWDTTRTTGRYFIFGMAPGRHTVLFTKGTEWAAQRDVEVTWGSDGQPEGVVLPDLVMRPAVTLSGTVALPSGFSFDTFFTWPIARVVDEETGQAAGYTVDTFAGTIRYTFAGAPVGRHRIRIAIAGDIYGCYDTLNPITFAYCETRASTFVAGPLSLDIPDTSAGLSLPLVDLTAAQPAATTGKLRFGLATLGGSYSGPWDLTVDTVPIALATPYKPTPDSGGWVELDLPPGLYSVTPALPATYSGTLMSPPSAQAVVIADQTTELGVFYFEDSGNSAKASYACLTDADCATGVSCTDGSCGGGQPFPACLTGDYTSECSNAAYNCSMNAVPTPCAGGAGYCSDVMPDSTYTCVPTGAFECLWNGSQPVIPLCGGPA